MKFFAKRKTDEYTIYISGGSFNEKPLEPAISTMDIEEDDNSQTLEEWVREKDEWAKQNDPNYYVHPKYWYERPPGVCGQGYVYLIETYHERIEERRRERLDKLKAKLPRIVFSAVSGSLVGMVVYRIFR